MIQNNLKEIYFERLCLSENSLTAKIFHVTMVISVYCSILQGVDENISSSSNSCADLELSNQESDESDSPSLTKETDESVPKEDFVKDFPIGSMVWGKLPGYNWWPGVIVSSENGGGNKDEKGDDDSPCFIVRCWVKWYGETQLSRVS